MTFPNWHPTVTYRSIYKYHGGLSGVWHQFWYDVVYWWKNGGPK